MLPLLGTREGVYDDCYADLLGFLSCTVAWTPSPFRGHSFTKI